MLYLIVANSLLRILVSMAQDQDWPRGDAKTGGGAGPIVVSLFRAAYCAAAMPGQSICGTPQSNCERKRRERSPCVSRRMLWTVLCKYAASASPLERLLIQQVTLCWLNLNAVEYMHSGVMQQSITLTLAIYWEKRLPAAQRRFTSVSLPKARF